jgi:hypothetical protein
LRAPLDASVIESDASRYHGLEPEKIDWDAIERPSRAVRDYLRRLRVLRSRRRDAKLQR